MKITKMHPFTGKLNTVELAVSEAQLERHYMGELAQNVFPHLTPDEREFLISGIPPGDWGKFMGEDAPDDRPYTEHSDFKSIWEKVEK